MSSAAVEITAAPQAAKRPAKSPVLTDADLHYLLPGDPYAQSLLTFVRLLARGRLEVSVRNRTLEEELRWDRRTVQRVKGRLRAAGIRVEERRSSHGGHIACRFVLDRRQVKDLRLRLVQVREPWRLVSGQTPRGGGANAAPYKEEKPSAARPSGEAAAEGLSEHPRAGPDPPSPPLAAGEGELERDPDGVSVPPPPEALEPELGELRALVGVLRGRAGRLGEEEGRRLVEEARARLSLRPELSRWRLALAQIVVVQELLTELASGKGDPP